METIQSEAPAPAQDETISKEVYNVDVNISEETNDIPEFHRGTVDNPFLYDASLPELERFVLTNMFVAGKNASIQQVKLDQFIGCVRRDIGGDIVDTLGVLSAIHNVIPSADMNDKVLGWLKEVKAGQYSRLTAGILQLSEWIGSGQIDLRICNRAALVKIKGIGYKTASMFLMYTRRDYKGACLDTHILKYLKEETPTPNVPDSTPVLKAEYLRLESEFLKIVKASNKSVAEFDFEIWSRYRQKVNLEDSVETVTADIVVTEPVATGLI